MAFAESWNGSAWTQTKVAKLSGSATASLTSVSCIGDGTCEAVGSYENESEESLALAESWNGTHWVLQKTPASGSSDSQLSSVSCVSASDCIAVGFRFRARWQKRGTAPAGALCKPQVLRAPKAPSCSGFHAPQGPRARALAPI